jgi:hypothetical protein
MYERIIWFAKGKMLICITLMSKSRKSYTILQKASSIFLMLVLFWLTISTPFIVASQQELGKERKAMSVDIPLDDNEDDRTESSEIIQKRKFRLAATAYPKNTCMSSTLQRISLLKLL